MKDRVIVLIEDDQFIREAFTEALHLEGFTVRAYRNGREAVDGLKQMKEPALILLDWMMPVMNGEEFLAERRQDELAKAPVVVVSALADRIGKLPGVRACLTKPIDLDQLIHTVKEYSEPPRAS